MKQVKSERVKCLGETDIGVLFNRLKYQPYGLVGSLMNAEIHDRLGSDVSDQVEERVRGIISRQVWISLGMWKY